MSRTRLCRRRFHSSLADRLRAEGLRLTVDREEFARRRRVKNEVELAGIRRAQRAAEAGMDAARELLRRAEPNGSGLQVDGEPLTSERIKQAIAATFTAHGMVSEEFIVSHGSQAAVGHDMGSGPIAAGETIVIDLWPKDVETACYADMTRTFVVGEPSAEFVEYHRLCKDALERSLEAIRDGVRGTDVFRLVCELFHEAGLPTQLSKKPGEVLEGRLLPRARSRRRPRGPRGAFARPRPGHAGRRRRRYRRARPVPARPRGRAPRGPRARHRGRSGEPDRLPVRPRPVSDQTIETLLGEERRYPPPPEFAAQANAQPEIYDLSFDELWEREGRERVTWFEPFTSSTSGSRPTRSGIWAAS